jgi:hypothetical protein
LIVEPYRSLANGLSWAAWLMSDLQGFRGNFSLQKKSMQTIDLRRENWLDVELLSSRPAGAGTAGEKNFGDVLNRIG